MAKARFNNGDVLKDKVTGLEGVVMVVAHYSTGCIHYGLQERRVKDDGTLNNWEWLDQSRLELVKSAEITFSVDLKNPGGPSQCGPQM